MNKIRNRKFLFCEYCCPEFFETDDNSWGDVGIYYKCKKSDHYKVDSNEWEKLGVPEKCIMALEYTALDDDALEIMWGIGYHEQCIEKHEKQNEEFEDKLTEIKKRIDLHKDKIAELRQRLDETTKNKSEQGSMQ